MWGWLTGMFTDMLALRSPSCWAGIPWVPVGPQVPAWQEPSEATAESCLPHGQPSEWTGGQQSFTPSLSILLQWLSRGWALSKHPWGSDIPSGDTHTEDTLILVMPLPTNSVRLMQLFSASVSSSLEWGPWQQYIQFMGMLT